MGSNMLTVFYKSRLDRLAGSVRRVGLFFVVIIIFLVSCLAMSEKNRIFAK